MDDQNNQIVFNDINNNNINNQLVNNNSNSIDYEIEKLDPIFIKNNIETRSIINYTNIYIFYLIEIFFYLIETIACVFILLEKSKNNNISLSKMFLFLIFFNIFHFILKIIQYSCNKNMYFKFYYHSQMIQKPCYAIFYFGISLFLENIINLKSIIYFKIPLIIISTCPLLTQKKYIYFLNRINIFLIPFIFQYILVILLFKNKNTIMIYPIFIIEIIISCSLSLFICIIFLSYIMSNIGIDRSLRDKMKNSSGFGIFFFLSWIGLSKYNIMIEVLDIFRDNENLNQLKISKNLKTQFIYFVSLGILTLLINIFCYFLYNKYKRQYIIANSPSISKITFKDQIDLKIKKISDYFFVKINDLDYKNLDEINENMNKDNDTCYICYADNNDILLKPCCHSGFCKKCFNSYIKKNINKSICPICKKKISHAYIIKFDEEKSSYFSQFKIIF